MFYPNIVIQAGSSKILKAQKKILKANLGSCVGIALFDKTNRVGGILHTLLPEPYSNFADVPEKYASSGLPKFIDELIREGAKIDQLKAVVAGGGFLESPDSIDLSVNIGGKTSERVKDILEKFKIPIVNWETGGFFSCSLTMDMNDFSVKINPFNTDAFELDPTQKIEILTNKNIKDKVETIKPIPQIILKIIRLFNDSTLGLKQIANEIKKDQVLSGKAIKLCNTAAFDRLYPINSIDEAIIQLGEENLIKHIFEKHFEELFTMTDRGYSLCQGGLFHHAISTALINEKLAEFTKKANKNTAYSAGLLHDIGKILLDQNMASVKPFFYRDIFNGKVDFLTAETNNIGMNHCEAGVLIAEKWNFPNSLKDAIKYHHNIDQAKQNRELVILTHISDIISSWFITGVLPETSRLDNSPSILQEVGLTPDKLLEFIDWLPLKNLATLFPVQLPEVEENKEYL